MATTGAAGGGTAGGGAAGTATVPGLPVVDENAGPEQSTRFIVTLDAALIKLLFLLLLVLLADGWTLAVFTACKTTVFTTAVS